MKVQMKSLGVKVKSPTPQIVSNDKPKTAERFPEVTLTTKNVPGLKEYAEQGKKCHLMFDGEVTSFRSAGGWEVGSGELGKNDISVTIKLTKGALEEREKPKDINAAKHSAVMEYKD
jgi:hypothetical protein